MSVFSVLSIRSYSYLSFFKPALSYIPDGGEGYFSSSYPDFLVVVDGVPSVGEIRVLLRTIKTPESDGMLVAKTYSDAAGQWYVGGLNPEFRYDVVCRVEGYRDIIFSDLTPVV